MMAIQWPLMGARVVALMMGMLVRSVPKGILNVSRCVVMGYLIKGNNVMMVMISQVMVVHQTVCLLRMGIVVTQVGRLSM